MHKEHSTQCMSCMHACHALRLAPNAISLLEHGPCILSSSASKYSKLSGHIRRHSRTCPRAVSKGTNEVSQFRKRARHAHACMHAMLQRNVTNGCDEHCAACHSTGALVADPPFSFLLIRLFIFSSVCSLVCWHTHAGRSEHSSPMHEQRSRTQ